MNFSQNQLQNSEQALALIPGHVEALIADGVNLMGQLQSTGSRLIIVNSIKM